MHSREHQEVERVVGERVHPEGKHRGQQQSQGMQRGVDPGAAVRQPDGIGRVPHPEGHRRQQHREPERHEVGDAPPPDEVVDALEGRHPGGVRLGQPRSECRAHHRPRQRRADRLRVGPAGLSAGHAVCLRDVLAFCLRRVDLEVGR